MKKVLVLCFSFFIGMNICLASDKIEVTFASCVDGDTAKVNLNGETIKIRFLAIDTPETKHPTKGVEPFGKEASEYTCSKLTNAKKIEIEYDENSDKKDKYDRDLVWVWVDDYLLQDELIKEGLAEVTYLYGNYKYTGTLEDHQSISKANKIGIWGDYKEEPKNYLMIGLTILGAGVLLFTGKLTKSKAKKIKKQLKKYGV